MKMNTSMIMSGTARRLLANKAYDIEFNGYLSNHVKHAVIALDRLDAPEARTQEYWDEYTRVTPYGLQLHQVEQDWKDVRPATLQEWNEWRGKKVHWQEQVVFLQQELQCLSGDTDKLVQRYGPDLLPGVAGALTHGLIHLGWAIDADSPWMICEGLAYLNFCYLPLDMSALATNNNESHLDESTPIDSLIRVARQWEVEDLKESWVERVKNKYDESFHPELVPAGFQWHLAKVLNEPHPIATELPSWLRTMPTDDLWESMFQVTVYLYLATRTSRSPTVGSKEDEEDGAAEYNGSFVLLHLMSSLWGLENVMKVLQNEDIDRLGLGVFYANMVILTATSSDGFPSVDDLHRVQHEFSVGENSSGSEFDWEPVVRRALKEEEEHNIKLVYVMKELWKRYSPGWRGYVEAAQTFTLTPNIGPKKIEFDA